jgi:hypothetical protein
VGEGVSMSLARRIVETIAGWLPPPRVIYDHEGKSPYLSRYYLKGRPTMPDGSDPFGPDGAPKREAVWREGIGIYLHKFHRGDDDEALHNHPWVWSRSLVLVGGYVEERRIWLNPPAFFQVERRIVRPPSWNKIDADDFHRVDLIEKDCWSLFISGPKTGKSWGFWDRWTSQFWPWREFITKVRGNGWDSGESARS